MKSKKLVISCIVVFILGFVGGFFLNVGINKMNSLPYYLTLDDQKSSIRDDINPLREYFSFRNIRYMEGVGYPGHLISYHDMLSLEVFAGAELESKQTGLKVSDLDDILIDKIKDVYANDFIKVYYENEEINTQYKIRKDNVSTSHINGKEVLIVDGEIYSDGGEDIEIHGDFTAAFFIVDDTPCYLVTINDFSQKDNDKLFNAITKTLKYND